MGTASTPVDEPEPSGQEADILSKEGKSALIIYDLKIDYTLLI